MCVSALGGGTQSIKRWLPVFDIESCISTQCPEVFLLSYQVFQLVEGFDSRARSYGLIEGLSALHEKIASSQRLDGSLYA